MGLRFRCSELRPELRASRRLDGLTARLTLPHQGNGNAEAAFFGLICATFLDMSGALFWFANLQCEALAARLELLPFR